jgi:shikimate dehydrogenase
MTMRTASSEPHPTGRTRLIGIVGDPIAQVKTPQLMNAALGKAGVDAIVVPMQVSISGFEPVMRGLMALKNLDGLIITVPHKTRAASLTDRLLATAQHVGTINVMRRSPDGSWTGETFDGIGLVRGMQANGLRVAGARVKQFGAGGAGVPVTLALAAAGAASIDIFGPHLDKVEAAVDRLRPCCPGCAVAATSDGPSLDGIDLLVNCSPVGMGPEDGMPAPFGPFDPHMQVVDIIMHPEVTPLLAHARKYGCRSMNGRSMIEAQIQTFVEFFYGEQETA